MFLCILFLSNYKQSCRECMGTATTNVSCFAVFILAIPRNTIPAISKFGPKITVGPFKLSSLAPCRPFGASSIQFWVNYSLFFCCFFLIWILYCFYSVVHIFPKLRTLWLTEKIMLHKIYVNGSVTNTQLIA